MKDFNEPNLDPGTPVLEARDSNGKTLLVGDSVKVMGNHHRPEFASSGPYQVVGLFTYTDTSHPGQNRRVTHAQLMKISDKGKLLHWSWHTQKWQEFVELTEPAIYADTTCLEKIKKEGATP